MHIIRETEKDTQKRVIEFFQDALNYTHLGNWADSVDENSNIIPEDLADWLRKQNYDPDIITKSETISTFDNAPLVQLIVNRGADAAIEKLPEGIRTSKEAIAAKIENNIRRVIVDRSEINPKYYEDMSRLLDELIHQRRQDAITYRQYLSEVTKLSKQVTDPTANSDYPASIDTKPRQAFFDNLPDDMPIEHRTAMAKAIDEAIMNARSDEWRGNSFKEREICQAIEMVILDDFNNHTIDIDKIFNIARSQDEY